MGEAAGNQTHAALLAGCSKKSAHVLGSRLFRNVKVRAAIELAQADRAEESGISKARVLNELALLAFSDLTHYTVSDNGDVALSDGAPAGAMRAVQSIKRRIITHGHGDDKEVTREVELRFWDKPGPLKLAGQHVGLFKDKVEHSGTVGLLDLLAPNEASA